MTVLLARCGLEGAVLALTWWAVFAALGSRLQILPLWPLAAGALLVLAGLSLGVPTGRGRGAVATAAISAGVLGAVFVGAGETLGETAGRLGLGALFGAVALWRGFAIAAGAPRWQGMGAASLAALAALAAVGQLSADRAGLVPLTIVSGALAAVGLSAARGAEEMLYVERRGPAAARIGALAAIAVGVGAIGVTLAFPWLRVALARASEAIGPYLVALLVLAVTPFVYLAEAIVRAILPFIRSIPPIRLPRLGATPLTPEEEAEYARQLAIQAEVFLRALLVLVLVGIVVALVLRALASRRLSLPVGATVERERVEGAGLAALARGLFARRLRRSPRPRGDDPAARVRRAYWDLLALAERAGEEWRRPPQTPREHLAALGAAWEPARGLVVTFERVRYGRGVGTREAQEAEDAVRRLEAAVAARA